MGEQPEETAHAAANLQSPEAQSEPTTPSEAEIAASKRAKAEKIGRYGAMFIMPLILIGMMITGYLGTMHSPQPNGMPVVLAGAGAEDIAADIEATHPGALEVGVVSDEQVARDMVHDRDAVAAIAVDGTEATLYSATAAGSRNLATVAPLVTPAVLDAGLELNTEDLAALPEDDPAGLGAMFLATSLVMAGYLPFSMLRSNSPELLKFRRIVPLLAGWSALIAGIVWAVTGPILGVVDTSHSAAVLGIAWLGVFAIGSVQLFLTRLFGAFGVIIGLLFLMVLGMPSSNMALSVYTMPGFYQFLHGILPMPAIGESMRSVLYFGGDGVGAHLVVLAIGAIVGLGATALFDLRQRRRNPDRPPLTVNIPSLTGGRRPDSAFWRYTALLAFPLTMVVMMVSLMLGAMGSPTPRDMPVAIVSESTEQAQETAVGLEDQMGDMLELTTMTSADDARRAVEERDLVAAFVLPTAENPQFELIANEAGNMAAYQMVDQVFTQIAAAQDMPIDIDNVQPLPERDSNGVVVMYVAMGWLMGGFMIVVVGANAAPASRPLKKMLPVTAIYSVFMSAVVALIAGPITGAVAGRFLALWGAGIIAIACIAMFAMVFERLMGMLAILPVIGILMFVGMPASNAALSQYMTPPFFRAMHDVLPMPAAAETVKSILYFGGDVVGHHLLVLGAWGLGSLLVVALIDRVKPVRTEHDYGNLDPRMIPGYRPPQDDDEADSSPSGEKELVGARG